MRKIGSLIIVTLLAVPMAACDEQPTDLARDTQVTPRQEVAASHGQTGVVEATAVYRAVDTEAARAHGFERGERVGTLHVVDDGSSLTVTGQASGLAPDADERYWSLFYDKASSAQGSPSSDNAHVGANACEPGVFDSDHPLFLTLGQMIIGDGTGGPFGLGLDFWDVDGDGNGSLGPTSTVEYVPVKEIGTVSIRDGQFLDPNNPEQQVVACGVVTHDPAD